MSDVEKKTEGKLSGIEGRDETRSRLCRILGMVHEKRVGYSHGPCDCICDRPGSDPKLWTSYGDALRWLEKFVEQMPKARAVNLTITEQWKVDDYGDVEHMSTKIEPTSHQQRIPAEDK